MRRGILFGILLLTGACSQADPATRAEQTWMQCEQHAFQAQAIRACTAVIDAPQTSTERRADALLRRGSLRAELNEQTRAFADLIRVLRLEPESAQAFVQRGLLHKQRGAFDRAFADFNTALRIDPREPRAQEERDELFGEQAARYRTALERLDRTIEANPRDASALNNRCWIRAILGDDLEQGLKDCNESLRLNPLSGNTMDSRGLVELKLGDFRAALSDYEAAVATDPQNPHFLYGRGLARVGLGMMAEGRADLAQAQADDPSMSDVYFSYGAPIVGANGRNPLIPSTP